MLYVVQPYEKALFILAQRYYCDVTISILSISINRLCCLKYSTPKRITLTLRYRRQSSSSCYH
ncbi:hypothetical protein C5167_034171 [Papaver somniferum]|uniref:Uncharacterized protein n=1 Tax=Papaver somniferum TaxID=3469 RepID=A0A4Y7KGG7_PAPSO|nr:hypothetical protein C5167_034171 [Papaver somniferum]